MRLAGGAGEGGRHGDHLGSRLGQGPVQMRETHVITDAEAELRERRLNHGRRLPRGIERGFPVPFAGGQVHVEHVDLVVGRRHRAVGADQGRAVGELAILAPHQRRADQDPDAHFAGQGAQTQDAGVFLQRSHGLEQPGLVTLQDVGPLGRGDELRPNRRGLAHQGLCLGEGGVLAGGRAQLDEGGLEGGHAFRRGSSWPLRSSAIISSQPPMCFSPTKICG